ncbi:hypothetical protein D6D19_09686 [Aureobasidium pullulans]|uniref:Uncharacterized protein n=1 Tax=Aureobasidium pullulans TaxID=5580 RepID=A0A4T0E3F4_AURPU|nr:hypothetical protein D6D28_06202 [Aureobasidium pullulans]THW63161.1 hypothetical protein D6D19_09686 [Aureobasidium pullulans]THY34049.1 hypothetical protein D6D00_00432 [Aureobasidium pullulans]THY96521.1 hypothetical protein D6C92_03860 [Aureobasidium pullulans]TIA68134.1 hypothetical protein D6C83_01687 [Aureobasidium pullulans]
MDKKEKKERKNSSHHRPHRHHHARDTITSAVQLQHPFSFENYNPLRRAQHHHHHRSRRDRSPEKSDANKDGTNEEQEQEPPKPQWSPEVEYAVDHPPRRLVTPDTITLERQLRERRQDHVSSALNALSRDAHTATRKLDDTYYALLQKVGLLKATIASFQDLHSCLDETTQDFATRSDSLVKDITGQIDAFQNMSQQDESIDQLVKRLHKAKERAESFESRLESCRLRLEQWEKKEQEKNKRNNRTWALALTGLTAFVILILAIVLWRKGSLASVTEKPSEWKEALGLERNKTAPGIHLADPKEEKLQAKEAAKWDRLLDEL